MNTLFNISGATFSTCRNYRYKLWRKWDEAKPLIMFIGLNPSTANENDNDRTVRRVIDFAKLWGYGGVYMMNSFPLVSTKPERLNEFYATGFHTIEEEENNKCLKEVYQICEAVVFAYGNFKIMGHRANELKEMFPNALCLKKNKNGSPQHPLYLPGNTVPVKF